MKSSTTPSIKKPTYANKSSSIVGRVSSASHYAKVQCHQLTYIPSNDYDLLSKFLSNNLNSSPKKFHCKINQETKKITGLNNTSNLSAIAALKSEKTIGLNNTNSLSSKPTASQKLETTSSKKERISIDI